MKPQTLDGVKKTVGFHPKVNEGKTCEKNSLYLWGQV